MQLTPSPHSQDGLTLVEVLVVMAVGLVIMAAVVGTTLTLSRAARFSAQENFTQEQNRLGLERMTRFVRQATYPEGRSRSTSHIFEKAEADEVIFFADLDDDGVAERVRFELVGDAMQQQIMECDDVADCEYELLASTTRTQVIDEVQNDTLDAGECAAFTADEPVFRYYERASGGDLSPMTTPVSPALYGRIAAVEVSLVLRVTEGGQTACRDLSSLIHLRNWRS